MQYTRSDILEAQIQLHQHVEDALNEQNYLARPGKSIKWLHKVFAKNL